MCGSGCCAGGGHGAVAAAEEGGAAFYGLFFDDGGCFDVLMAVEERHVVYLTLSSVDFLVLGLESLVLLELWEMLYDRNIVNSGGIDTSFMGIQTLEEIDSFWEIVVMNSCFGKL